MLASLTRPRVEVRLSKLIRIAPENRASVIKCGVIGDLPVFPEMKRAARKPPLACDRRCYV